MITATTRVPGKLMLAGEYAVLRGKDSLAVSLDQFISVKVSKDKEKSSGFLVKSSLWKKPIPVISSDMIIKFNENPLCETVAFAMNFFDVNNGTVEVDSNLSTTHGVGTSSAIRIGVLASFRAIAEKNQEISDEEIGRLAFQMQKNHQSHASGYDIITQLLGGIVHMSPVNQNESIDLWPGKIEKYPAKKMQNIKDIIHIFVGGVGAPTSPVMRKTMKWIEVNNLQNQIEEVSQSLIQAFINQLTEPNTSSAKKLIELIGKHRAIFEPSPCYPTDLSQQLKKLEGCDSKWSFKTTGAGGEDALILGGKLEDLTDAMSLLKELGWQSMPYKFDDTPTTTSKG